MSDPALSLPDLPPPPGGLARLRHSVEAGRRRRGLAWGGLATAACGLAMLLALAVFSGLPQRYRSRAEVAQAVRQAVQPAPPGELRVIGGDALALDSGQPGVRLYLVQSMPSAEALPRK